MVPAKPRCPSPPCRGCQWAAVHGSDAALPAARRSAQPSRGTTTTAARNGPGAKRCSGVLRWGDCVKCQRAARGKRVALSKAMTLPGRSAASRRVGRREWRKQVLSQAAAGRCRPRPPRPLRSVTSPCPRRRPPAPRCSEFPWAHPLALLHSSVRMRAAVHGHSTVQGLRNLLDRAVKSAFERTRHFCLIRFQLRRDRRRLCFVSRLQNGCLSVQNRYREFPASDSSNSRLNYAL